MAKNTVTFSEISKDDTAIAGGKGASLGEMASSGIPVPPGFVVTAAAFEEFLLEAGLENKIDELLASVDVDDLATADSASAKIRSIIKEAELPEVISEEISQQFLVLDTPLVAVRSSATAEDSSVASWGGQLESYLNVKEDGVLKAVQKCWSSLFTPRAIVYRREKNLGGQKVSVAVVVQKMVQSEVSGVAWTVHPVTSERTQMVVEAGFGLGEAIVGGMITPDTYVLKKDDQTIHSKSVPSQEIMVVRDEEGDISDVPVPREKKKQQKLSDEQIVELARLCLKIERHYGFPVDIEWALEAGNFYIVQSRPITTL